MNKEFIIGILIGLLLISNIVLAIPGIPHQFYGFVTYNGQPAPDGLSVVAKIKGVEVASTTTYGGKYGYTPIFYVADTDPPSRSGSTINFFVNGIDTGKTAIFQNGGRTQLDLTATGPSIVTTTPTQSSSNGGGGGGGGGAVTTTTVKQATTTVATCQEKWTCTQWSACKDGIQTRTCKDDNKCGTDLYKPFESQPCATVGETEETTAGIPISLTGFATLLTSPTGIGLIIIIIVLIVIIIFLIKRRMPRKESFIENTEMPSTENTEESSSE
jgi:hypothetical protein